MPVDVSPNAESPSIVCRSRGVNFSNLKMSAIKPPSLTLNFARPVSTQYFFSMQVRVSGAYLSALLIVLLRIFSHAVIVSNRHTDGRPSRQSGPLPIQRADHTHHASAINFYLFDQLPSKIANREAIIPIFNARPPSLDFHRKCSRPGRWRR